MESNSSSMSETELMERNRECDLFLSFATTNYQNRDYTGAVQNYMEVINFGCIIFRTYFSSNFKTIQK